MKCAKKSIDLRLSRKRGQGNMVKFLSSQFMFGRHQLLCIKIERKFYSQTFLSRILKNFDKMCFEMSECAEVVFRNKKLKVM